MPSFVLTAFGSSFNSISAHSTAPLSVERIGPYACKGQWAASVRGANWIGQASLLPQLHVKRVGKEPLRSPPSIGTLMSLPLISA